ncbi:MAG: monomethylamine:corrinoid methyltransferase [Chloroflexi bacterium]|nr:monomethylamine:corrinoid methyltransferase [Chloroflexota bacterium]
MGTETTASGLKEFIQRSLDGPVMRELDFDLKLGRELRRVTSEYSIRFHPEEMICDDALADSIWQAALQLLERVGIYNVDTNRVVFLGRDEVDAAAASAPKELVVGEGKDAVKVNARSHDSKAPPLIMAQPARSFRHKGGSHTFVSRMLDAYASDAGPLGHLARQLKRELEGIPYLAETPGEMIWARAIVRWQRAVAKLAGKPGLWLANAQVSSPPAILACYMEDGLLNRFNSYISVHLMPELKLNWDCLRLAYAAQELGVYRFCAADPILGGYCRNSEEAAVVALATLLGYTVYASPKNIVHTNVVNRQGNYTTRGPLQASSAARRAVERNLAVPMHGNQSTKNGLGTTASLYELAALTLAQTGSGMAWAGRGYAFGLGPDGECRTDLDWKFVTRVSRGASGLNREKTNDLLLELLEICESQDATNEGKPFDYYYDIKTLTPSAELVALYAGVEEELQTMGIPVG